MSKFITMIPVDVASALALLPKRATANEIRFNPDAGVVEIEWDDDDFVTPYTFASEFPLALLKARKLPKGVLKRKLAVPEPVPTQTAAGMDETQGQRGKGEAAT